MQINKQKILVRSTFYILLCVFGVISLSAQSKKNTEKVLPINKYSKTSAAYAEVLLHKTGLEAELEAFLLDYTEEFPKVKELRFELGSVKKEMDKILAVKPEESSKLTLALGKLMVKKVQFETDLWALQSQYKDDHPEVKRAKRRIEIYENAIKEIMN